MSATRYHRAIVALALVALGLLVPANSPAASVEAAKCLESHGKVTTSPARATPWPWRFGLVGRKVSVDFKQGNALELWFYASPARAKIVRSGPWIVAKARHTSVGVIGSVLYAWDPKPTKGQTAALAACLR